MSIQLIVNGNDISDYVVSSERSTCICNPIGSLELLLEPNLPAAINPYEDVVFKENGVTVFTGFTYDMVKARMPIEMSLTCYDPLIKAKDTWLSDEYVSCGQNIGIWTAHFLEASGIVNMDLTAGFGYQVYEGYTAQYQTAMDSITSALKMCPLQIYADATGTVRLAELRKRSPVGTISEYIDYERTRNDRWLRNRAVVMGHGFIADQSRANDLLPGEIRTVVIATGMIYNLATAYALVEKMLDEFENPLDVKVVTVPGNPNYALGQTIHLMDTWSGYDENCIITSINSLYSASTYQTEITFDEKCVNFWGWDRPPIEYQILYCGTWGRGVWKSENNGTSWSQTGLENRYVYDIHHASNAIFEAGTLWAACRGGVHRTTDGGEHWNTMDMGNPRNLKDGEAITEDDLYWVGVVTENYDSSIVYVLAGDFDNQGMWVYKSSNNGASWANVRIR